MDGGGGDDGAETELAHPNADCGLLRDARIIVGMEVRGSFLVHLEMHADVPVEDLR
jgi:hypothetical protein